MGQLITNIVNNDPWEDLGELPVAASTRPDKLEPSWPRPNLVVSDDDASAGIRWQLESWVLASAGTARPTASVCDEPRFTGAEPTSMTCTVTYDGQKVVYEVTTRPKGRALFEWEASATYTVATREGLLARVHSSYGTAGSWSNLRCERFSDVTLVRVGEQLGQVCYGKLDDRIKTSKIHIKPNDRGEPHLETEHQDR